MIRLFSVLVLVLLGLVSGLASAQVSSSSPASAEASAGREEQILDFTSRIQINPDSSVQVRETIVYDFGDLDRHGIFREIPVKYRARGGNFNVRLDVEAVVDETGRQHEFVTSNSGDNIRIRIGDPDSFVTGEQTYVISYSVNRAINFFETGDELFWNVTGNEWSVLIREARAEVILPESVPEGALQVDCFAGGFGSVESCESQTVSVEDSSTRVFFSDSELFLGEGLTVAVQFPKGIVTEPSATEKFLAVLRDNIILLLPVGVFILLLLLWRSRGRDPQGRGTIVAEYEPPNKLSPAEVGTIVDERADKRDISAEIIYLATKGYLKIKQVQEKSFFKGADYELIKLKDSADLSGKFQRTLLNALFDGGKDKIQLSDLKQKFAKDYKEVVGEVYESVVKKGYFDKSPHRVRNTYLTIGIIILFLGFWSGISFGPLGVLSMAISAVLFIIFSFAMPARTHKGVIAKEKVFGLKEYLSVAEKDRLKFHNAPERKPEQFEELLPYAMALGVEKQWAKQFADIYEGQPSWYEGSGRLTFNSIVLASVLSDFSSTTNQTLAATASSGGSGVGGGGFSGGGFGGGGGGSW